jgi:AcrR family transcriptional regulator
MSPRRADPRTPIALLEAAARLLAEEGPAALSTRRLAAEVGTSTMSVYTYFGGMDDLVRAMVLEGFARLERELARVRATDDPVADAFTLGYAYRANALTNRHLYAVMLGSATLGGFALSNDERQAGRYTLARLIDAVDRAITAGRWAAADPNFVAQQLWTGLHGHVALELGGYLVDQTYDADTGFDRQLRLLALGVGDDRAAADRSLSRARRRRCGVIRRAVASGAVPGQ